MPCISAFFERGIETAQDSIQAFDSTCHDRVRVGAGLFEPLVRLLLCLTKKPIPRLGDRGAGPPECDRANLVVSVSTLGAPSWDNSSCPSPSGVSSERHSMASGTLGSEAILYGFYKENLSFVSSPDYRYLKTLT